MGDAKKVLTNQKTKTTDEFLVKKKQPLELPPEFDKLPIPDSVTNKKEKSLSEDEKIKDILRTTKQEKNGNENFSQIDLKGLANLGYGLILYDVVNDEFKTFKNE